MFRIRNEAESALRLIWERFVNTRGTLGHNISLDLHLECLNYSLNGQLKNLKHTLTESNAERISRGIGKLKLLETLNIKTKNTTKILAQSLMYLN